MSDPYLDLCLGIQAVRRKVEREVAGLGGSVGVAAIPYPHQLANVQRVLSDTRIRHLLADEVGLGKTVQTLMILNALRLQNERHRALILVPENLAPQWLLECKSRSHFTPLNYPPEQNKTGWHVRLAYYEQLQSITEIDPNLYDLLIVDEIQRMQSSVRQRIVDVGAEFRQLLLLSATPKLEDTEAFRQLITILEPERMAVASRESDEPEGKLLELEAAAATLIQQGTTGAWAEIGLETPPERARPATVAATYSVLRRVIHTRRRDYPDLLPQRVLHRIAVEPTSDEIVRQESVWQFIGYAGRTEASIDLARLGQVALRSPRALSERINRLRGRDLRDPQGYLQKATEHLELANGDSRLEALIDLLVEIWNQDPDQAVLVVAEDNPTVDYLERMVPRFLPEIGPRGRRRRLSVAVKRNRDAAATDNFVDLFHEYDETLSGFVDGEDQLLIAADVAQVGLNLQHARNLVFFSIPWSPAAVEQWIGRLDRLGSAALSDEPTERTVEIYVIYQRGQVDERVVAILDEFTVFKRSIRLDGDEINMISQHIVDAALAPHNVSWQGLAKEARLVGNDDADALVTPLSSALPWRPGWVRDLSDNFDRFGALGPVLESSSARRAIVRIEAGLRGWMRLMARANGLRLWKKSHSHDSARHFRLLHHYRPPYSQGRFEPRFALPGIDPSDGQRYAYLDDRRALESPPIPTVDIDGNPSTPLNFLDHGDPMHDALVAVWTKIGKETPACLKISLPDGHPLANDRGRGAYIVAILSWVPGDVHFDKLDRDLALRGLQEARTDLEKKPFLDAIQQMEEHLRSDQRWLNSLFIPRLDVLAARFDKGQWTLAEPTVADALCMPWDPTARGKGLVLAASQETRIAPELKAARDVGMRLLIQEHSGRHQRSLGECPDLQGRIASRRYMLSAEADDQIAWREASFADAMSQGMETSEQGFTRSRFRAIRNARDMAIHARDIRLARIDGLAQALAKPAFNAFRLVTLIVE